MKFQVHHVNGFEKRSFLGKFQLVENVSFTGKYTYQGCSIIRFILGITLMRYCYLVVFVLLKMKAREQER